MKADLILSSDWHLRGTPPRARTDDWLATCAWKLSWLDDLAAKHDAPIIVAGDITDSWQANPETIAWAIRNMPRNVFTIPGNHDLPQHSMAQLHRSFLDVLYASGAVTDITGPEGVLRGFAWDEKFTRAKKSNDVAVVHTMVFQKSNRPHASTRGHSPRSLAKALPGYKLIVSGDNHVSFTQKVGDTWIVNPGPIFRMDVNSDDYQPYVYLWNREHNRIKRVAVPVVRGVIDDTHHKKEKKQDEQITAFVTHLKSGNVKTGMSFRKNMERTVNRNKNKIDADVRKIIWECLDDGLPF